MDTQHDPLVLMVEDDPLFADIVAQRFAAKLVRFMHAPSGEEALKVLEKPEKPDIVLLDLHLTGMSGYDVLEKMRANPATQKLPVVVLSNFNAPEDIERSKKLGALRHIQKISLTPAQIVDETREVLSGLSGADRSTS